MKRFLLPILLIVLCLAGLGAGIWLLTSRGSDSVARGTNGGENSAAKAAESKPLELEGEAGSKPASERSAESSARPAGALVLHGSVRAPAGVQDPGPIVVYALSDSASYRELARLLDTPRKDSDAKNGDELAIRAQCKTGPDGSFELPLPEGSTGVHLALQGRFLYLEHTRDLELARAGQPQLAPKAGAFLSGTVALPEGTDLAALEALRVELDPVIRGAMAMWDPLESTCRHASLSIL